MKALVICLLLLPSLALSKGRLDMKVAELEEKLQKAEAKIRTQESAQEMLIEEVTRLRTKLGWIEMKLDQQ